jgi:hypothetical protein
VVTLAGLPKKYAKMGFKRGWAAYNRSHKRTRKSKSRTQVKYMARRRKGGFRKKYRRHSGSMGFGSITKILIGAALAAVYEVFVSPMIPLNGLIKNIGELAVGIMLAAMPRMPMPVKAFGTALAFVNAYQIIIAYLPTSGGFNASSW